LLWLLPHGRMDSLTAPREPDRREGCVLDVDPRPDAGAGADDWEFPPPDLVAVRPVGVELGARSEIESITRGDSLHAAGQYTRLQPSEGLRVGCHVQARAQRGASLAACGSCPSTSFIPAVPAAWSVTAIPFN
jgi:hypothetical protein